MIQTSKCQKVLIQAKNSDWANVLAANYGSRLLQDTYVLSMLNLVSETSRRTREGLETVAILAYTSRMRLVKNVCRYPYSQPVVEPPNSASEGSNRRTRGRLDWVIVLTI